jgi:uncharacterized protein YceH (UPF0502 family)
MKESRYAHLLGGEVASAPAEPLLKPEPATLAVRAENERIGKLEEEVAALRREVGELREQLAQFRRQFD